MLTNCTSTSWSKTHNKKEQLLIVVIKSLNESSENYVEWNTLIPKSCISYDSTYITILKWHNYKNEQVRLSDLELRGVRMWMWLNTGDTRHPCSHENVFNSTMASSRNIYMK